MIDRLHYVSQPAADGSHISAIHNALLAGCKWIQLRVKDQQGSVLLSIATHAAALCKAHHATLIINDRPDMALLAGADGVHLGLEDLSVAQAREIAGPGMIIGGTANTFGQVMQRATEGVDYIGLGPYRFTNTKKKLSPILGLEGYERIIHQAREAGISIPIIAIGGIETADVPLIRRTGIDGVAISGAITHAADPQALVAEVYQALNDQENELGHNSIKL